MEAERVEVGDRLAGMLFCRKSTFGRIFPGLLAVRWCCIETRPPCILKKTIRFIVTSSSPSIIILTITLSIRYQQEQPIDGRTPAHFLKL